MASILVVDDSMIDQRLAGRLLQSRTSPTDGPEPTGFTVTYAANGREALAAVDREAPAVIVTDLLMPEMTGLELVREVRARHPLVPVVLMTAHGSEEMAVRALQAGAASYVPKRDLARDLLQSVEAVVEASKTRRGHARLMKCLTRSEADFVLDNDPSLIPPLVGHLRECVFRISSADETELVRVTMALREALMNAMEHGNLEMSSDLRGRDDKEYHRLADERRSDPRYAGRRVHVTARDTPAEAVVVIRDEGPGFDTTAVPDPTDPANLEKSSGRGLLLMRAFMSEVRHNAKGNEVALIRRPES
ncbi:ATP-binding response regulator [Urbifossiella limnaea]|uniref:Nitrogen regulation protein NR(I) n=1 Tax=Urbifossiella limnaea TaxID=2528023 RepID=A0A517XUZ1_9BACT|nr:response regulator [Urbifossiella limnaea]QDU21322.1 Nitrogen regulation protein NR(I) [Urbifossiella limnaea]